MKILLACLVCVLFIPSVVFAQVSNSTESSTSDSKWQPNARAFLFQVPFYRQEKRLTCELASLRSALAGIGIQVSEWDLWARVRKDFTKRSVQSNGEVTWGDPDKGFVGNPNGLMPKTGYGVFLPPIMELANWYATSSVIDVNDPRAIDRALAQKHPIIIWSVIGNPTIALWKTPAGKNIQAPVREHTRVIVGYRGTAEMMEGLYIIDPLSGLQYISWDEFHYRNSFFQHIGLEVIPER